MAVGSGGHLVPLLDGGDGLDASLLRRLYVGPFLARWGARCGAEYVGVLGGVVRLYMIRIWPDSLLFAAIYGVVESSSVVVFSPMVGALVDRLTYLQVLGLWLLVQCLSFVIAGVSVTALLVLDDLKDTRLPVFVVLMVVTNVSGALAALSTLAGTILIEREWVVVICSGHPAAVQAKTNSVIRRIDLVSVYRGENVQQRRASAAAADEEAHTEKEVGLDEAALDPAAMLGVMGSLHEAGGDAARACPC